MQNAETFAVRAIGRVESALTSLEAAPRQPDEGAPSAWLIFDDGVGDALGGVRAGDELIVLTWLDRARRDVLVVHPRGDVTRPPEGVFSTRSPHRPNPIGLHRVRVSAVDGLRVQVDRLEALNGTPIVDVKAVLAEDIGAR
jgi:tRNA-Thr(GGU) m(6)t(6)A37 methyltransferase TsaA